MLRQGLSPAVAFKAADLNFNGVVTLDELRESVKKLLPEKNFSLAELKRTMMAFDINRNGLIEEEEFIRTFEDARKSNVTIIESPKKDSGLDQERKKQLPTKGRADKNRASEAEVTALVAALEARINLKKFFGELSLGGDGEIPI